MRGRERQRVPLGDAQGSHSGRKDGESTREPTKLAEFVRVCVLGAHCGRSLLPYLDTTGAYGRIPSLVTPLSPRALVLVPPLPPSLPLPLIPRSHPSLSTVLEIRLVAQLCLISLTARALSFSFFLAMQRARRTLSTPCGVHTSSLPFRGSVAFGRLPTRLCDEVCVRTIVRSDPSGASTSSSHPRNARDRCSRDSSFVSFDRFNTDVRHAFAPFLTRFLIGIGIFLPVPSSLPLSLPLFPSVLSLIISIEII